MAFAVFAVLGGPFSRIGYGRRIAWIAASAGIVRIIGFAVQAACDSTPALNILQYVIPIAPIIYISLKLYPRRYERSLAPLLPVMASGDRK
jgi:lipopolysaccharide export system permease protein